MRASGEHPRAGWSAEAELVDGGEAGEKDVLLEVLGPRAVVLPLVAVGRFNQTVAEALEQYLAKKKR